MTSIEVTSPAAATEVARGINFSVAGRVVVITGGGQAIGREYARQFAAAGAIPVIADINEASAHNVVAEIEGAGGSALAVATDVGDPGSVQALCDTVLSRYGRVDVLVNNAAVFTTLKLKPFFEIPLEEWERVMRVNVTGCFLTARALSEPMREGGWGRIINVSSDSVVQGAPGYLHYVSSKSALLGMSRALATELGPSGITVNTLFPGATFTEIPRETITEEGKARVIASQCIQRPEVPMDLVGLVVFLSTEAASFITGQAIAVDGGLTKR
jgi:NAD(P)-dependent dehydrogenase (short-subunit alcohol dehydrogenase family)